MQDFVSGGGRRGGKNAPISQPSDARSDGSAKMALLERGTEAKREN